MNIVFFCIVIIYALIFSYFLFSIIMFYKKAKKSNSYIVCDGITKFCIGILFLLCIGFIIDIIISIIKGTNSINTIVSTFVIIMCLFSMLNQNIFGFNDKSLILIDNNYEFSNIVNIRNNKSGSGRIKIDIIIKTRSNKTKKICLRLSSKDYLKLSDRLSILK